MARLTILDGLRGYFLVLMFLNHLTFAGGYLLVKVNHGEVAFVEGAQGFVFLSGLLAGLVHTRRLVGQGFSAATGVIWQRAAEIYAYALGCILVVLMLQTLLPESRLYWHHWLGDLQFGRRRLVAASALLLYQPDFLDILPQYVVYLLAAPLLIVLCVRGRSAFIVAGCVVLWLAVQFGLHLPLAASIEGVMPLRAYFNVLAWQLLFVGGLIIGSNMAQGRIDWNRLFRPDRPQLAIVAAALVAAFAICRVWTIHFTMPDTMMTRFMALANRGEFGMVYLLNFAALGYLVTWIIRVGPATASVPLRRLSLALDRLFNLSFLRLLGRNSLQVYAWHVIMVYLLKAADHNWGPFGEATKTAMATAGIALLAMPALMLERWRRPGRNRKASISTTIQPLRHQPTRRRRRDLVGRPVD